ncbi:U-box domain-containing protein 51-like isoform X2 [Momordica charantia]|uniref:RING-type E3 ubiquitin transferase n=1 Tax=Momordica charantia TaxID=3673 RepID=A0A6J1BRG1_MOMCH|nr:U-box domain-containing protein 51-like isoform X2 [Momordica charantia]
MSPSYPPEDGIPLNTTAVAIDKDKNSQHAVRWAIDHLVISNPLIILIHVRHKSNQHQSAGDSENGETDAQQLFVPYRGYCARKGVQLREVVLDDTDVPRALVDYVHKNCINNFVVGSSTRSALARKFKGPDVPTSVIKTAPEFCSVYVISKGKIISARAALRPVANTAMPPRQPSPLAIQPNVQPDSSYELENGAKGQPAREGRKSTGSERILIEKNGKPAKALTRERPKTSPTNISMETIEVPNRGSRTSFSRDSISDDNMLTAQMPFGSMDVSGQNLDFSISSSASTDSASTQSTRELEAEMKRLKLELKQTMDMYSSACKEAISAKNKARELSQWKQDEARKFEEVRLAEEAALAIAEMEKAKCKAAIEAAEAAQKLAEREAQRRKQAEMKARREAEEKKRALSALAQNDVRYRKYTIEEIEEATEKFSEKLKIGEGGYGPVYGGKLDHTAVAIKVLRPDAAQGRKQFQQEVEVLCCIRHPNMVLLLGACPEYGCLVYEYMHNGSLEDRLFRRGNTPPLSWRRRFKVAAEIATALLFLHQAKPDPLVHRDLKPANILLDRNYVSKISDVGLARLVPPSVADQVTQYHLTSAAGTFCYIDPEYQQTGKLTTKSDVYSFGILLLQIITAKPPMGLAHHVQRAIEKEKFDEMMDPTISDCPLEEAINFAKLALTCAELRKRDRPDLGTVIVPELNRLRDIGRSSDKRDSRNLGHFPRSAASSSSSRPQSSTEDSRLSFTDEGS